MQSTRLIYVTLKNWILNLPLEGISVFKLWPKTHITSVLKVFMWKISRWTVGNRAPWSVVAHGWRLLVLWFKYASGINMLSQTRLKNQSADSTACQRTDSRFREIARSRKQRLRERQWGGLHENFYYGTYMYQDEKNKSKYIYAYIYLFIHTHTHSTNMVMFREYEIMFTHSYNPFAYLFNKYGVCIIWEACNSF